MTMPTPPGGPRTIELPEPEFPALSLIFTDNFTPDRAGVDWQTVQWVIAKPHPFDADSTIVRMFAVDDGVEVYSAPKTGAIFSCDFIPMSRVRLYRETMPVEVFAHEIDKAETAKLDDDPEPDPEPEPDPANPTLS